MRVDCQDSIEIGADHFSQCAKGLFGGKPSAGVCIRACNQRRPEPSRLKLKDQQTCHMAPDQCALCRSKPDGVSFRQFLVQIGSVDKLDFDCPWGKPWVKREPVHLLVADQVRRQIKKARRACEACELWQHSYFKQHGDEEFESMVGCDGCKCVSKRVNMTKVGSCPKGLF